mmetsp:Transcript_43647/g.102965  ORF Transcript_43647/g.102965 Transcript_43647/m.102965 type:complete len:238 (+) Transcript_43647:1176-1889(+)
MSCGLSLPAALAIGARGRLTLLGSSSAGAAATTACTAEVAVSGAELPPRARLRFDDAVAGALIIASSPDGAACWLAPFHAVSAEAVEAAARSMARSPPRGLSAPEAAEPSPSSSPSSMSASDSPNSVPGGEPSGSPTSEAFAAPPRWAERWWSKSLAWMYCLEIAHQDSIWNRLRIDEEVFGISSAWKKPAPPSARRAATKEGSVSPHANQRCWRESASAPQMRHPGWWICASDRSW